MYKSIIIQNIDEEVYLQFKLRCVKEGISMQAAIRKFIKEARNENDEPKI